MPNAESRINTAFIISGIGRAMSPVSERTGNRTNDIQSANDRKEQQMRYEVLYIFENLLMPPKRKVFETWKDFILWEEDEKNGARKLKVIRIDEVR